MISSGLVSLNNCCIDGRLSLLFKTDRENESSEAQQVKVGKDEQSQGDFRRKRKKKKLTTNGVGSFVFDGNGTVNETSIEPAEAKIELGGIDQNAGKTQGGLEIGLIIPLYVAIFVLSIVGNSLVLATLARHKRMRTVTNVYLLNLAVSDLLLGVFCMPFTLVGQVLRNFIFGAAMCKLIPYFQAVCVSVGVWTLVAISLERYFAICRPLKSRRWQTQFHAYKMIVFVWISSLLWTSPIVAVSRLKAMKMGRHKCREEWPSPTSERAFNLFLDAILLLVPLVIMSLAYSLIVLKLWKGLRSEIKHSSNLTKAEERRSSKATMNGVILAKDENESGDEDFEDASPRSHLGRHLSTKARNHSGRNLVKETSKTPAKVSLWLRKVERKVSLSKRQPESNNLITSVMLTPAANTSPRTASPLEEYKEEAEANLDEEPPSYTFSRHAIRSTYMDKSIEAKKKVIRMLFVVVAEFFVCWAPLHVLNTWYLFSPEVIYQYVGSTGVSLVQLLAYISSCCNPITYCFMNKKFRQAFLKVFHRYSNHKNSLESLDSFDGWDYRCGEKARELLRQKKRLLDEEVFRDSERIVTLKKKVHSACNLYDPKRPFSVTTFMSNSVVSEGKYFCDWYPELFGIDEDEIPLSEDEEGLFDLDWDELETEPKPKPYSVSEQGLEADDAKKVYQRYQYPRYGRRARQKPILQRENHEKFECICDIDLNYSRHYIPRFHVGVKKDGEELKTPHFKSFWEDYYDKAGFQESERWSKIFETVTEEPEEVKGFFYRPTPKFPGSKKKDLKRYKEQLLASFRPLDCREVRRYRMPYAEAIYLELQEDLYLDSSQFFKHLIVKDYLVHDAVDSKHPRLRNNRLMINRIVSFLKLAEKFARRKEYHKETTVLLRSGKYFCDYDKNWWWLAEEFYTKSVEVSQNSVLDGGRVTAIAHFVLGTFLLDYVHRVQPAQEHLLKARELSMGKDWNAKTILQKDQDSVYKECAHYLCRALIAVSRDLRMKGKPEEALPLIRRSHKLCEESGSQRWDIQMETLFELGMTYQEVGYLEWAINAFRKFIEIALLQKCTKNVCDGYLELSICLRSQGDLEHCHRYLQTYLKTAEANEDENLIAFGNRYLGEFFLNNGNSKLAAEYFKKAFYSFHKQSMEILNIPYGEWQPEHFSLANDVELTRVLTGLAEGETLTKPICHLILEAKDKKNQQKILQLINWKNNREKIPEIDITSVEEIPELIEKEIQGMESSEPLEPVPEETTLEKETLGEIEDLD